MRLRARRRRRAATASDAGCVRRFVGSRGQRVFSTEGVRDALVAMARARAPTTRGSGSRRPCATSRRVTTPTGSACSARRACATRLWRWRARRAPTTRGSGSRRPCATSQWRQRRRAARVQHGGRARRACGDGARGGRRRRAAVARHVDRGGKHVQQHHGDDNATPTGSACSARRACATRCGDGARGGHRRRAAVDRGGHVQHHARERQRQALAEHARGAQRVVAGTRCSTGRDVPPVY
jgi:hypothetical protein